MNTGVISITLSLVRDGSTAARSWREVLRARQSKNRFTEEEWGERELQTG